MGDIGGLFDAMKLLGHFLISFATFVAGSGLDRFLISQLFKFEKKKNRLLAALGVDPKGDEDLQIILMSQKKKQAHLKRIKNISARAKECIRRWARTAKFSVRLQQVGEDTLLDMFEPGDRAIEHESSLEDAFTPQKQAR